MRAGGCGANTVPGQAQPRRTGQAGNTEGRRSLLGAETSSQSFAEVGQAGRELPLRQGGGRRDEAFPAGKGKGHVREDEATCAACRCAVAHSRARQTRSPRNPKQGSKSRSAARVQPYVHYRTDAFRPQRLVLRRLKNCLNWRPWAQQPAPLGLPSTSRTQREWNGPCALFKLCATTCNTVITEPHVNTGSTPAPQVSLPPATPRRAPGAIGSNILAALALQPPKELSHRRQAPGQQTGSRTRIETLPQGCASTQVRADGAATP